MSEERRKRIDSIRDRMNQYDSGMGKLPPQAIELEEAILGAVMLDTHALVVMDILSPECFYKDAHARIFGAQKSLKDESKPIDILTVTHQLRKTGELEMVGGPLAISKLTNRVASTANVESHARIILEKFLFREMIRISADLQRDSYDDSTDVFELMDRAELLLLSLKDNSMRGSTTSRPVSAILNDLNDGIEARQAGVETGMGTGFPSLNKVIYGWNKTDLVVIAARPGVGKSGFILSSARNLGRKGHKTGIFSLEMSSEQMVGRLVTMATEINYGKIMHEKLEEADLTTYHEKLGITEKLPIEIDDTPGLSINEIRARGRRMVQKGGVELIIIDYLQKIHSEKKNVNREQEISEISGSLKNMAKELKVPVIALSQLSRKVEERANKRPILSDLRDSGAIEQDADIVGFIYRPEYYEEFTDASGNSTIGVAEIDIAKNRHGELAVVKLNFKKHLAMFAEFEYQSTLAFNTNHSNPDKFIEPKSQEDAPF